MFDIIEHLFLSNNREMDMSKYLSHPKFIHNLWNFYSSHPDKSYCISSKGVFETTKQEADDFLDIRTYCTGYNSVISISEKSGVPADKIDLIIGSLNYIGLIREDEKHLDSFSKEQIVDKLITASELWAEQLSETHIFTEIMNGEHSYKTFIGFLFETYHYVKEFPKIIEAALTQCIPGSDIDKLLVTYKDQEVGHERFIIETLKHCGYTADEVIQSVPLVSTINIINLMKSLCYLNSSSILLIAKIVESDDYCFDVSNEAAKYIANRFNLPRETLEPFLRHAQIDYDLGHYKLLNDNKDLVYLEKNADVNRILNDLHDIKHAFDVQKLEIIDYYNHKGNYIPRQKVDFFGV